MTIPVTVPQDARAETFKLTASDVEPVELPARTLDEVSLHLPQGTFTTLRTYGGNRFLRLEAHLDRLDESDWLLGHPVRLDRVAIRASLREVLHRTGFVESRVRITVGLSNDGKPGQVYLSVEPFLGWPAELYEFGVRTITRRMAREQPRAKYTAFIAPSRQVKRTLPPDVYEVLMVNDQDQVLEGFTSNFFALLNGALRTAGESVLEGITGSLVLEVARRLLPVRLEPVCRADVPRLSEAFLTSASREVIPIVEIDGQCIGAGVPGPMARQILVDYRARVLAEAQPA
jgi:branched-chain amino acid aminotransferase